MTAPSGSKITTGSELALQRARKVLERWCAERNRQQPRMLRCLSDGTPGALVVIEGGDERPLLRLSYTGGQWRCELPCSTNGWQSYPGLSELESLDAFIDALEQAPLAIHW